MSIRKRWERSKERTKEGKPHKRQRSDKWEKGNEVFRQQLAATRDCKMQTSSALVSAKLSETQRAALASGLNTATVLALGNSGDESEDSQSGDESSEQSEKRQKEKKHKKEQKEGKREKKAKKEKRKKRHKEKRKKKEKRKRSKIEEALLERLGGTEDVSSEDERCYKAEGMLAEQAPWRMVANPPLSLTYMLRTEQVAWRIPTGDGDWKWMPYCAGRRKAGQEEESDF
jgi:hypothetical protein